MLDLSTAAKRFRFVAIAEAFTWVGLLIGMAFKYLPENGNEIGWTVNLLVSHEGGLAAAILGSMAMERLLGFVSLDGPLVQHPLMVVALAVMVGVVLLGSWGALWLVNRLR